ncbi:VpsP family polysaccharide biosynthesis protein [Pseudoalteromonas sp. Angola-18]|uniref:VpsP family polysaccharide biosynthesis protein n=1 Tax=Pseudoalteromonas sp. Angola-18 TaxID=3025338 RepID=UPI00235822EE|nr:VpsP family polysaccharide biosynthesis protein [Pseudoalteromonas sp. Angola-18]MDC9500790.1 VpsP family polysaccharide biosynthesis protein [Pseudoalteromonas sp. Angola-18]
MVNLKTIKHLHIFLLALLIMTICYSSVQSMRANSWYFNSLNLAHALVENPTPLIGVPNTQVEQATKAINLALTLEPHQAHYWHFLAYLNLLSLGNEQVGVLNTLSVYKSAEVSLLNSVKLRGSWAESWILLAQVVSYQQGPSKQVFEYINNALNTGPYKLEVHLGIIQIALANWQQLTPQYKAQYVKSLIKAAQYGYRFNKVYKVANDLNAMSTLCLSLQFGKSFDHIKERYIYKQNCL